MRGCAMSRPEARVERAAAIRSYLRAGFAIEGEVATPDGLALLMFRHRDRTP